MAGDVPVVDLDTVPAGRDGGQTALRSQAQASNELRRTARHADKTRCDAEKCTQLVSVPVRHADAAGIDSGDASHCVCVKSTPDDSDTVREFPVYTPGLR